MAKWIIILMVLSVDVLAAPLQESWYNRHAEGWFWYKDDTLKSNETKGSIFSNQSSPTYYTDRVEKTATKNKEIFNRLIIDPNEQNLKAYLEVMDDVSQKIDKMRDIQKDIFLQNPKYDPSFKYPSSQDAIRVHYQQERAQIESKVRTLTRNYGLVLFVKNGCQYCEIFEPTVKSFVEKYKFSILPVAIGGRTKGLFKFVADNGISNHMRVIYYPSLYLFEYATERFYPVAFGAIALEEIEKNAANLVR